METTVESSFQPSKQNCSEPTFQKPKHIDTENLPQPTIIPEFMFQPEFLKIYRSLIVGKDFP